MQRYQNGNLAAFEQLYRRHKDPLWRYFLRAGQAESLALELAQETWTAVIKSRSRYEPRAKFSTWLYHLAHSKLIDQVRVSRPGTGGLDEAEDIAAPEPQQPERQAQAASTAQRILAVLAGLSLEQREAFVMQHEAGMSLEEIGAATGVGRETVKSRLRYALAKLRQELADEYP